MPAQRKNHNLYARVSAVMSAKEQAQCILLDEGEDWSYGDLSNSVGRFAGYLCEKDIEKGDRILVQTEKSADAVALYLACLQLGVVYVPVNTAATMDEVRYFIDDALPSLVVLLEENRCAEVRSAYSIPVIDSRSIVVQAQQAKTREEIAILDVNDLAAILYTSGTTGQPKGAMLTHGNLRSNAETLLSAWGWQGDDILLHALPIYHVHGLFVAIHCVLLSGTAMWFLPSFDVKHVVKKLSQSTVIMGVPTYYIRLLKEESFNEQVTSNMRLFISGSAPLSEQTFHQFFERTGHRILERYGMSETIMLTSNPLEGERVAGTVGFELPGVEVRIADSDGGVLPIDAVGQIEVRGPNVFEGYWNKPDKTATEFTKDGFFKTGDMAFKDHEGRVSIVGRAKDLVISGGLNVYPAEIETLIDEVEGVEENAVIGVPHPDFGEGVVAVVVAKQPITLTMVRSQLRDKVASYKHPKAVVQVGELPKNAMGKIQKNVLREQNADLFESN